MKKHLILLFLGLTLSHLQAQSLEPGQIMSIHNTEVTLKEGVTMDQFEEYWINTALPAYRTAFDDLEIYPAMGIKGACTGCVAYLQIMDLEVRDKYWKANGEWTAIGQEKSDKLAAQLQPLFELGSWTEEYTDWVILPAEEEIETYGLSPKVSNPFHGTWALIYGEYSGNSRDDGPFQYKLFDGSNYIMNMKSPSGVWDQNAFGTYRVEGNKYIETFKHTTAGEVDGGTAEWEYMMHGDTLVIKGPTTVYDAEGNRNPEAYKSMLNSMLEKRVRINP